MRGFISNLFPFLRWLPEIGRDGNFKCDVVAGISVALVLIPQSMAYAQLAGLPAHYGLYASFLPPMIAALFGSSRQLATGPVAVVSLLSAAALEPLATSGSEAYLVYAILLALLVGLFQLSLGLLRLGVLVNFLSHPVVLGFTNAAAIIIATSQLPKLFGVSVEKSAHHYETVWNVLVAATQHTHFATLFMGLFAFALMWGLYRLNAKLPSILIAVSVTTSLSWMLDYDQQRNVSASLFTDPEVTTVLAQLQRDLEELPEAVEQVRLARNRLAEVQDEDEQSLLQARHDLELSRIKLNTLREESKTLNATLKTMRFQPSEGSGHETVFLLVPPGSDSTQWRITGFVDAQTLTLEAGGEVVGIIPGGLPAFSLPRIDFDIALSLFASALAIALIGFMEAISIAKAMAARTRQRLDANQELIGQGLSNIVGSLYQCYPVSGSFSRSAVNLDAGGKTGFSSIVTSICVVITLLWLTPLLYHLPQATLAAIIVIAVLRLVNFKAMKRLWTINRYDAIVALITFALTLLLAPHLDQAILVGVILSLVMYLYHTMRPRVAVLSRYHDGSFRDHQVYALPTCDQICLIRFDGSLYFANISYFEDVVWKNINRNPSLRAIIIDMEGVNFLDATGEQMLESLSERLRKAGIALFFSRTKKQIYDILKRSGFVQTFGKERFFRRTENALEHVEGILDDHDPLTCPLRRTQ